MKSEVEVKFINRDHNAVRKRLLELGGTCEQPMRLMRRVTIETPYLQDKNAFVRVRDEGRRVTMTYKQFDELSIDGAKEIEVTVGNFQDAISLLDAAGLSALSYQESKRETWLLSSAEVVLDEWPWLMPYIEIEADDEETVRAISVQLGFEWQDAVFGDVMSGYRIQYPHLTDKDTIGHIPEVKFEDPLPPLLIK
jgi:adenylate cyclase class 2